MASSKGGQWALILVLIGIIALAFLWQKRKRDERRRQTAGRVSAVVSRVTTGDLPLTGEPQAWQRVNRFPLWENAPQEGRETDWRGVRLAHDGRTLFAMLDLPYPVKQKAPKKKGTFILGQIKMDTDRDASTGAAEGEGETAIGIDRQVTVLARREEDSAPLCVGYFLDDCSGEMPCEQIGDWVTTCSSPEMAGHRGEHVAFGVPLSKLGLQLPAEIIFAFEPFGGSGMKQYQLSIR